MATLYALGVQVGDAHSQSATNAEATVAIAAHIGARVGDDVGSISAPLQRQLSLPSSHTDWRSGQAKASSCLHRTDPDKNVLHTREWWWWWWWPPGEEALSSTSCMLHHSPPHHVVGEVGYCCDFSHSLGLLQWVPSFLPIHAFNSLIYVSWYLHRVFDLLVPHFI